MKDIAKLVLTAWFVLAISAQLSFSAGASDSEALGKLKALVGHWEQQKSGEEKTTLDIELTAGGSAVLERSLDVVDGKQVPMTTVYYLDGGDLRLTHYCMAGNQPTMRGTYSPDTKTLTFDFVGATNMKNPNDGHMHRAVYVFVDNDHVQQTWTFRKNQKDTFSAEVLFVRK
jgi:hypothetical protein